MPSSDIPLIQIQYLLNVFVWFEIISICFFLQRYGLGFIGNLFSILIFLSQEEFRNVSTGVLFLLMTISNTIHLWTLVTEFLVSFDVYVYSNEFFQCRFNYFIQNVSRAVSTYLAVSLVLDRLIRTEFPVRARIICTRTNTIKLTIVYICIFSILLSFWFCPLNSMLASGGCYTGRSATYTYFINNIFFPVRFGLICVIPIIIMSLANIRIVYNITKSRRRVRPDDHTSRSSMTSLDRMLFYMMLINVIAFIFTQIPFNMYAVIRVYSRTLNNTIHLLVRTLFLIWSSVYFGIGSYLYCLASPHFRQSLWRIICCRR